MLDTSPVAQLVAELYDKHRQWLLRKVYRKCGDPELTRDIVQETFVRALTKLPEMLERTETHNFGAWLQTVAFRLVIDERRYVRNKDKSLEERIERTSDNDDLFVPSEFIDTYNQTPEEALDESCYHEELSEHLWGLVDKLPHTQSSAIRMRWQDELGYDDMAIVTGKTKRALRSDVHRGYIKIRRMASL